MHVVTTRRRYKDKVYRAHLLRRSYREGGKVKNETLANLSALPDDVIDLVRDALRGHKFVRVDQLFDVVASPQHGHVAAVHDAMRRLGFAKILASKPCKERDLVLAMVTARIVSPQSKLATSRWWHTTTIPEVFGVEGADEDALYAAMDWLLKRQPRIEKKLAQRHLFEGGLVLYDLSSSYFEGRCCPLARLGHSRDRKKGTLQVNYGLVTDALGCPVSISAFPGDTADVKTFLPQIAKVREHFGIESLVVVGDRGMISQRQIDALAEQDGIDWVTALRFGSIRKLVDQGHLQLGLFDERNLFELQHPDYPGERLIACRNVLLADHRARKRRALIEATAAKLAKIRDRVRSSKRGRLRGAQKIALAVGRVIDAHKVGKLFTLDIGDDHFDFRLDEDRVAREAALDGVYVIRTSVDERRLDAAGVVRTYKRLSSVERAFRSLKTVDLLVRPIHHWAERRVRAHLFLCMLAYYVQYHMQEAWRPLLFADEEAWTRTPDDVVAPARRSASALEKVARRTTRDGQRLHSFRTLIAELGGIVRNRCRRKGAKNDEPLFTMETQRSELQDRAFALLEAIGP